MSHLDTHFSHFHVIQFHTHTQRKVYVKSFGIAVTVHGRDWSNGWGRVWCRNCFLRRKQQLPGTGCCWIVVDWGVFWIWINLLSWKGFRSMQEIFGFLTTCCLIYVLFLVEKGPLFSTWRSNLIFFPSFSGTIFKILYNFVFPICQHCSILRL